jgi:hypothetical protein
MNMNIFATVCGAAMLAFTVAASAAPAASHKRPYGYEQGRQNAADNSGLYTGRSVGSTHYRVGGTTKR